MASENSGRAFPPINLSTLLAVFTLVGGIWLVSNKLTSNRPVTPAGGPQAFVGEQTLESRLWEDPFKSMSRDDPEKSSSPPGTNLYILVQQIEERSRDTNQVLLMPVMLPGGQYSEDRESRIRSRFAVVSALGRSGYVPEDAEHLGQLRIPWLTQNEVDWAKHQTNSSVTNLWAQAATSGTNICLLGANTFSQMDLRYEWYRPRTFYPNSGTNATRPEVLVLWLDDSFFEDEPLLRLALLLEPLTEGGNIRHTNSTSVALIGPRRSSTLRAMLPGQPARTTPLSDLKPHLWELVTNVNHRIRIYSATSSATDETLVKTNDYGTPRSAIRKVLAGCGFASFQNFAATDSQLAGEMLEELKLRGADFTGTNNHLVLVSEWDTFYGRMLSLTYAAELYSRQAGIGSKTSRLDFIEGYVHGTNSIAMNFHSFVYLRGLDGQTVGRSFQTDGSDDKSYGRKSRPSSIEDLRDWLPDANKAQGQAQFDYLGRLGDQLTELESSLGRENKEAHIRAIGIVGSDVYDTLLILQALRHRFPSALFFTSDLDARFTDPRERDWARNLIVASAYGLALNPRLQQDVAPFRDSLQTAQFAAVLAALGDTNLAHLTEVPPRRFEIGNRTAVDLSVTNIILAPAGSTNGPWLHPLTARQVHQLIPQADNRKLWCSLVIVVLVLAGAAWYWRPARHLTVESLQFLGSGLDYSAEDIGGPDGAEALLEQLRSRASPEQPDYDPICHWMVSHKLLSGAISLPSTNPGNHTKEALWKRENALAELTDALIHLFNKLLRRDINDLLPSETTVTANPKTVPLHIARQSRLWTTPSSWRPVRRLLERRRARRYLDHLMDKLGEPWLAKNSNKNALEIAAARAAATARVAAVELFRLRCRRLICFWAGIVVFSLVGIALGRAIWQDTLSNTSGEPFSLTNGTSAWPAQIMRLLVLIFAVYLICGLYYKMREAFFVLTRRFYFSSDDEAAAPSGHVCAAALWQKQRTNGEFWRRIGRIALPLIGYVGLCFAAGALFGELVVHPVRGRVLIHWNICLLIGSVLGFLLLTFLTIDSARLCHKFIRGLTRAPTAYQLTTRRHFRRKLGNISEDCLDEWIDVQLIAELTERVGRLVYYPSWLLLALMLARNGWWDRWSWPVMLIIIFTLNFMLALASVIILQKAARNAKKEAEESLTAKVKKLKARITAKPEENDAAQAEKLLEEIHNLNRGAFVSFWNNPVVGAIFLQSGGLTLLQVLVWFMGR